MFFLFWYIYELGDLWKSITEFMKPVLKTLQQHSKHVSVKTVRYCTVIWPCRISAVVKISNNFAKRKQNSSKSPSAIKSEKKVCMKYYAEKMILFSVNNSCNQSIDADSCWGRRLNGVSHHTVSESLAADWEFKAGIGVDATPQRGQNFGLWNVSQVLHFLFTYKKSTLYCQ